MKRPGDNEPEPAGGRAAERLREFLRQRLPENASPEEVQAETERWKKQEAERSPSQQEAEEEPSPAPRKPRQGSDNPE
jgi:hypothetical protein